MYLGYDIKLIITIIIWVIYISAMIYALIAGSFFLNKGYEWYEGIIKGDDYYDKQEDRKNPRMGKS